MTRSWPAISVSSLLVFSWAHRASAEVKVGESDGWSFWTDGRVNAFLNYTNAEQIPNNVLPGSWFDSTQLNSSGRLVSFRIRSGFVGAVLGFSVKKDLTEDTKLSTHIAIWGIAESARDKGGSVTPDMREAYAKIDGPWGGVLAGRTLELFSRGAIQLDFNYGHGNGLGNPCNIDSIGPTCGHVGFGVIFPGFGAGIVYNTPELSGFKLTAGMYDPAVIGGNYTATPLPRLEGEAEFNKAFSSGKVHLFVNGEWQKVYQQYSGVQGQPPVPQAGHEAYPDSVTSRGVGYGGWLEISALALGFASHFGYGLGMTYAFENTPTTTNTTTGELRKFDGYYVQGRVAVGPVDLMAGYGISRVFAQPTDVALTSSLIKSQTGISAGINYHVAKPLILDLDFFNASYKWYYGQSQTANFLNAGLTALW